jgi:hypothetical protein
VHESGSRSWSVVGFGIKYIESSGSNRIMFINRLPNFIFNLDMICNVVSCLSLHIFPRNLGATSKS